LAVKGAGQGRGVGNLAAPAVPLETEKPEGEISGFFMHAKLPSIITQSRKWVPPGVDNLIENPPKSPFSKGGLFKGCR